MNRFIRVMPRILRMADGEGGSGGGDAHGSSASSSTGADGKTVTVGQVAEQRAQDNSARASVPFAQGSDDKGAPDWREGWGDDLKNNPALKDFKTPVDLAKSYIETKKMVGQKTGIPGPDATPEQKAEFYKALGVPDDINGYDQALPDDLPESIKKNFDPEHAKKWAGTFKEANLTSAQAKIVRDAYMKEVAQTLGEAKEDIGKSEANFKEVLTKHFGDKMDAIVTATRADIEKTIPAEMKPYLETLDNNQLALLAAYGQGLHKIYGGEDKVIQNDEGNSVASEADLRKELRDTMSLPEYSNPFAQGKERHNEVVAKAKKLSDQIANLKKTAK